MNNLNESKVNIKDLMSWLAITLVTVAAFYCTYSFTFSGPIQAMIWLSWLVAVLILGYLTTKGKEIYQFALEAKMELLKVVWPTRQETVQTTTIVMVMVTVTGFVLWGIDSIMMWAIAKITHLG